MGREAQPHARVVELVDAPDSKSGSARSVGSSPTSGTRTRISDRLLRVDGRVSPWLGVLEARWVRATVKKDGSNHHRSRPRTLSRPFISPLPPRFSWRIPGRRTVSHARFPPVQACRQQAFPWRGVFLECHINRHSADRLSTTASGVEQTIRRRPRTSRQAAPSVIASAVATAVAIMVQR